MESTNLSSILSYPVAKLSLDETIAEILMLIEQRRGHIITANAEILYAAQSDKVLDALLRCADIITADGMGVVLASRILGEPVTERVSGYDLLHALAAVAQEKGLRLFLLGAAPGIAERAAERLRSQYPGVIIAGTHHGFFTESESQDIALLVRSSGADFLFAAMGPRGEAWIAQHIDVINCPAMQVGGSFDILAGISTRAPQWMQRSGLEWAYRLYQEPYRYKRMLNLPKFMLAVLAERLCSKGGTK